MLYCKDRSGTINPSRAPIIPTYYFHPNNGPIKGHKISFVAVDFGKDAKFAVHPQSAKKFLPDKASLKGLTKAEKALANFESLLSHSDVVCESATIGSVGISPGDMRNIVASASHQLYTISTRMVYNKTRKPTTERTDQESAKYIHEIAQGKDKMRKWRYLAPLERLVRYQTATRPAEQHNYRDENSQRWLAALPPVEDIPEEWLPVLTKNKKSRYKEDVVLPFGMALADEEFETRDEFERIIGCYQHGYPSVYRRAFYSLATTIGRHRGYIVQASKTKGTNKVHWTPTQQKECTKEARRMLRWMYYNAP